MSRAPPAPGRGKSILVQVSRNADPAEEETCEEIESPKVNRISRGARGLLGLRSMNFDPPQTNGWFFINDTASVPEISEIFRDLPPEKPVYSPEKTSCVLVGTHLYHIGGSNFNQIRRFDTNNPSDGWKSEELPFNCAHAITAVSGNFIYLIEKHGCCVYDTIKQKAHEIEFPISCELKPTFCVPLEGSGVLVPVTDLIEYSEERTEFYLHSTDKMEWKRLKHVKIPFSKLRELPFATSNGVFYVYDIVMGTSVLYAYEIGSWKFHGLIPLPKFKNLRIDLDDNGFDSNVFMVPVSDSELCFLWRREIIEYKYGYGYGDGDEDEEGGEEEEDVEDGDGDVDEYYLLRLCYAKVSITLDPPVAVLLKEAEFKINATEVLNCLPYDSSADQNREEDSLRKSETEVEKKSYVYSNKQKKKEEEDEVDWKERCVYLEKENRRLMQELQRVLKQDHITESPEKKKLKRPSSKLLVCG